jgi:pimeloyl-ACP methyl ester carboxylesterase
MGVDHGATVVGIGMRSASSVGAVLAATGASERIDAGPAILLIHGWSQNHLCWKKQWESALADEFRLVAVTAKSLKLLG